MSTLKSREISSIALEKKMNVLPVCTIVPHFPRQDW
jgi:hypothetical protein